MEENDNKNQPLNYLVFSVAMRKDSLNTKLAKLAAGVIEKHGGKVDYAEMKEFDASSFNQDLEVNDFHPEGAKEFQKRLLANDAFIIASPEYNAAMPGVIKNAIDWASRFHPQPFKEKHGLLMSASPSMVGGNRGLWSLRVPLEHLGAIIYPDMFSLAVAHQAFNANEKLENNVLEQRFENTIIAFMDLVEAAKKYPCLKKAWVEFLGEKPDALIDRVE
jgi:NAD(P)H-dependent FMN reductase